MEVGIERAVGTIAYRNAAGNLAGQIVNLELREAASPAFASQKPLPGLFHTACKR
jgi:hypothetical protein